jgi:hypothetical protein
MELVELFPYRQPFLLCRLARGGEPKAGTWHVVGYGVFLPSPAF